MCSVPPANARTSSPTFTGWAGFARSPLTLRWPALQASDAAERVLNNRTAHAQESTRTLDGPCCGMVPDMSGHRDRLALVRQRRLPLHQAADGATAVGRELLHDVRRDEVVHG